MRTISAIALAVAICACAPTMRAAPAGVLDTGVGMAVNLQHAWTLVPANLNGMTNGAVLTRHGVVLNRVDILSIEPGKSIIRAPRGVDTPVYRAGMSEPEMVELVSTSLGRLGFTDVATVDVRPQAFNGAPGVRFGLTGKYPSGLNMRGDAALSVTDGKLNVILFLAPAQHYYDASATEIDQLIQSARPS